MTTDTAARSKLDEEREWLARLDPLPTAEQIAGPILRGLYLLHQLAERVGALELFVDDGQMVDDARQLVDLHQCVAELVRRSRCHAAGTPDPGAMRRLTGRRGASSTACSRSSIRAFSADRDRAHVEGAARPIRRYP